MWPNPHETADLVTSTEEILNEKLRFLCSADYFILTKGFDEPPLDYKVGLLPSLQSYIPKS